MTIDCFDQGIGLQKAANIEVSKRKISVAHRETSG
jgi:hypothetical protein